MISLKLVGLFSSVFAKAFLIKDKELIDNEPEEKGYEIYLLFVIQRDDCEKFQIAKDIDPKYYELLVKAVKKKTTFTLLWL